MACVYCCVNFDDPSEFRKHMDDDHKLFNVRTAFGHLSEGYIKADCTDLRCRICDEQFDQLELAAGHIVICHNKSVDLNYDLGIQPFNVDRNRFTCSMCNWKGTNIRQLSRHTQSHFRKYTCEACGKSYSTMTALRGHVRYTHTGDDRICRKCRQTFPTLEAKREHLNNTPKCWAHVCNVCCERFISWNLKQTHQNEIHGAPKKTYQCHECPEVFPDAKKFRMHFKIAHTDDNFVCPCCGQKFASRRELEDHQVVHTKEKSFVCVVCSKMFARKKNLEQHMWIHRENKRFSCLPCNKVFNQRVSWRTHMKSYHPDLVDPDGKSNLKFLLSVLSKD